MPAWSHGVRHRNVGYHTMLLSRLVGDSGRVHAFEPIPATADSLEETLKFNELGNVTVHRLAVGASAGTATMRYGDASESGRAHIVEGTVGYRWDALTDAIRLIEVPVTSLDALYESGAVPLPSLVKIDVEGAELLALTGMQEMLRAGRPTVVAELWGEHNVAEANRLFSSLGYRLSILSEWRGLVAGEPALIQNVVAAQG